MSLGYLAGDVITIMQLALKIVLNTRKACGEYEELTQEVLALHLVLRRLKQELTTPKSLLNRSADGYREEIEIHIRGCSKVLRVLDTILKKYNRLGGKAGSWRKLWQQITFGNGEIEDLGGLRNKMLIRTSALSVTLTMASLDSLGRTQKQTKRYIREIKTAIHGIAARLIATSNDEGSVLSSYADDDKSIWEEFRKRLCVDGISSSYLKRHRAVIMACIAALVDRGLLNDVQSGDFSEDKDDDRHEQLPVEPYSSSGKNKKNSSRKQRPTISLNVNGGDLSDVGQGHYYPGAVYPDKYPNKSLNAYPNTYPITYPNTYPYMYPGTFANTLPNAPNINTSLADAFPNARNINIAFYGPCTLHTGYNSNNRT